MRLRPRGSARGAVFVLGSALFVFVLDNEDEDDMSRDNVVNSRVGLGFGLVLRRRK